MTRRRRAQRRRILRLAAIGIPILGMLMAVTAVLILRSQWFYDKLRQAVVTTVERATGGRAEIEKFNLDWQRLRIELRDFTIHGKEPKGKPPLFHAKSITVGLKIVSLFKKDVDIQSLEVIDPNIYLIVYPDGSTNVPEPMKPKQRNVAETILNLAIGRFNLENGSFEVESRYRTPFSAQGKKLEAYFDYEAATPRYRGNISVQPLDLRFSGRPVLPAAATMAFTVEKNRIGVTSGKVTTRGSTVDFSGTLDDLTKPRVAVQYNARVRVTDAAGFLHIQQLKGGTVHAEGNAKWAEGSPLSTTGRMHASNLEYRDATVRLRDWQADGAFTAGENGLDLSGLRVSGSYLTDKTRLPVQGHIASAKLRQNDIDLRGMTIGVLGGNFQGDAQVRNFDRVSVSGQIVNFFARRSLALYSDRNLPWDARVSGNVRLEASLRNKRDLRAATDLTLAPAPNSAPVYGRITANYDARLGTLDFGRSTVTLPNSRADFSGTLGRQLRVHAETRNLQDILPLLSVDMANVAGRIERSSIVFDGTVTGPIEQPSIAGHVDATGVSYAGTAIDSLAADVTASSANVRLERARVTRGKLTARFQVAVGLQDWRTSANSQIFGDATIDSAPATDLLALAGKRDVPITGVVNTGFKLTGTIGNPLVSGDFIVSKGSFRDEPFDRMTAHINYANDRVEIIQSQIDAGPKQVRLSAWYSHAPNRFDTGRLRFQIESNTMPLDQIRTLQKMRPDVRGTANVSASGELDLMPAPDGSVSFRPVNLQADLRGQNLQFANLPPGTARVTATSQGQVLRTRLDATFADAQVRGEGQWRLEGDYPGEATITFSKLDLAQVRSWLLPSQPTPVRFAGSVEGQFRITGPALKPESLRAELRLPTFTIGTTPQPGAPAVYSLENAGPIVATLSNNVVTIGSARLRGRETDLALSGRVNLKEKSPLDLRVDGQVGLAILQDFSPDIASSGVATVDATVRGDLASPQLSGRLQFQDAAFNIADLPLGISNADAVILFNGERATIQSFTGETGGGTVALTGFVAYQEGEADFNIGVRASNVRVRYPEGVSTTANATLTLTGTNERSLLAGSVVVLRTGFNPRSDFSSVLASQPVRTPAARTGILGGMNLDIQINTSPDIQFQSSLTQDLQVDGSLKLRGTAASPGLLGRINITQGQVLFYGTKYTISQGSIAFYNPSKIEPILDIDLETRARGIDITLTISGPLDKLNMTPRSDPPMPFADIIALLATGSAPDTYTSLLTQPTLAQQSWQQAGASAMLGQVITSPVTGRLQRFFGVSRLRIDPTLPGVESSQQARITIEQQVSQDITFTYITSVTSTNPQVIRIEWAVSRQFSVVALREENGVFGLDFYFKKRF